MMESKMDAIPAIALFEACRHFRNNSAVGVDPITTPDLLSLPALARALRVTQGWLRAEAEAGRIPALPAGKGRYLFSRVAVETALTQRAAGAQGAAR